MEPDGHTHDSTLGEGFVPSGSPSPNLYLARLAHRTLKHLDERERARVELAAATKAYKAERSAKNARRAERAIARMKKAQHRVARSAAKLREATDKAGGRS